MLRTQDLDLPEVIASVEIIPLRSDNLNKYHDFECCEWTRGIDTLLLQYKQDRNDITNLIANDPNKLINIIWKQDGPLAIDNGCRCQMGSGEQRSPFACAQCKNLRRLIDFRMGGVNKPFQIECGNYTGKKLIVSSTEITTSFLMWDYDSARRAKFYIQQYHNLTQCGTFITDNLRCITGDSFTIRTLILWEIAKIFNEKGLPHIPTLYTSFICSGTGYSLYDMPSIGTMAELHKIEAYHKISNTSVKSQHFVYMPLRNDIARTIIIQLLVILHELSQINFSHGTPSIHALIFNKDPISHYYDGFHVNGPITLQISDFWNSSATFNNVHYFPKNIKSSMYIERNMFIPEIATKIISMAHCHDIETLKPNTTCPITNFSNITTHDVCKASGALFYRLTNNTIDTYNAIRHIGFPLYVGSFDFYCFMVSLMCDKSFFESIINDDKLYRLWSMMWLIEDISRIENLIKETHEIEARGENSSNNRTAGNIVINIIRGAWLRCDIVKYLWGLIKLGW